MSKKMVINCGLCDARVAKEDNYKDYKKIVLNSEMVLVTEKSKNVLSKLPLVINSENVMEFDDDLDINIKNINGNDKFTKDTVIAPGTLLIVNGYLEIDSNIKEEQFANIVRVCVNGCMKFPQKLNKYLGNVSGNGRLIPYPDDYKSVNDRFILDKLFVLRAKQDGKYFAMDEIIINKDVDLKEVISKNLQFKTTKVVLFESQVNDAVMIFDEDVEFIIIPDECTPIFTNVKLNEDVIKEKGSRLFIFGELHIDKDINDIERLMKMIDRIIVKGDVIAYEKYKKIINDSNIEYNDYIVEKEGNYVKIANQMKAYVDAKLISESCDGVEIENVASVIIDKNVTDEMIIKSLVINNCALVKCSEEQKAVITAVSSNVASIGTENEKSMIEELLKGNMVNAETYVM